MKKIIFYFSVAIMALLVTFVACKKNDDGITISNNQELTQTAYADESTTGSGFTFTATGNWTATAKETTGTKGSGVSWLRLLLNGTETYSGGAGTFTLVVSLDNNYTGQKRTATIDIVCGNNKITISVTQEGTTEGGETPTLALVSRMIEDWDEGVVTVVDYHYDAQNRVTSITFNGIEEYAITYPSANKIYINSFNGDGEFFFTLNEDGYIIYWDDEEGEVGEGVIYEYKNGYLIKEIEEWSGEVINYTWENGNLVAEQGPYGTGTYSYGTIPYKEANIAPYLAPIKEPFIFAYFPATWFGKRSKNLIADLYHETNADGYVTKTNWGGFIVEIQYK